MNDSERESLDMDVLFVGAGPASLAGAYHLARLINQHNENAAAGERLEPSIAVVEKGKDIGSHALSGGIIDPRSLRELFPGEWRDAPLEAPVEREKFLFLTRNLSVPLPIPPPMENEGNYVVSLARLLKWMAPKVEEVGVDVFCEFPAVEALVEGDRVVGVRTGDRGIDREGNKKANYAPGMDIRTQVVVLGEGPRGTLTKQLEQRFDLCQGKNPQVYALGIKEIWELPPGRMEVGEVIHTVAWPLDLQTFGGSFVYMMRNDELVVGFVLGLDYENPHHDPHREFQRFKTHPLMARILEGGKMTYYGAKTIPEGGWWSMPRLWGDGFLLIGDSGGFVKSLGNKGIHLAMKSGMLAAETIFEALRAGEVTTQRLSTFEQRVDESWAAEELRDVRNFHQAFSKGTLAGMFQTGVGMMTRGRGWGLFDRLPSEPGHSRMRRLTSKMNSHRPPDDLKLDGKLTFDKLANVYNSATSHEEDQPVHLHVADSDICIHQCAVEYDNPCQRFCPANVYEMVDDTASPVGKRLQINASNCVHCKACDIMDPYEIITWVPPEGGGGPNYSKM